MVHVDGADIYCERAIFMGVQVINPPTDYPFGERQCTIKGIGGHRWTFSQTIAVVDPGMWGGILFE